MPLDRFNTDFPLTWSSQVWELDIWYRKWNKFELLTTKNAFILEINDIAKVRSPFNLSVLARAYHLIICQIGQHCHESYGGKLNVKPIIDRRTIPDNTCCQT